MAHKNPVRSRWWHGNPWDFQGRAPCKEQPKEFERFQMWYKSKITLDELADKEGISIHTLLKTYYRCKWRDRLENFTKYADTPEHVALIDRDDSRYPESVRYADKIKEDDEFMSALTEQFYLIKEQFDQTHIIAEKLNKAAQIAVNALLADKERLESLSVSEIKHLVNLSGEVAGQKATLSGQAKSLDKLAEHYAASIKKRRNQRKA